jgi:hypothetical protein
MSRYIDKEQVDTAINIVRNFCIDNGMHLAYTTLEMVMHETGKIPTADVVEVRHGHWIKQKPDTEAMNIIHDMGLGKGMSVNSIYWTCSICENWGTPTHKYCCSCGAKMDGERRER